MWPKIPLGKNFRFCMHKNILEYLPSKHNAELFEIASNNCANKPIHISYHQDLRSFKSPAAEKGWKDDDNTCDVNTSEEEWFWSDRKMLSVMCTWRSVSSSITIIPLKWLCKMKTGYRISWRVVTWPFLCCLPFMSYRLS